MGFDINTKRDPAFRNALTERDREYVKNCRSCTVTEQCGGWSVWNDARWCDGPGSICFDECRAICSKAPEKLDFYARNLGEGNYVEEIDENGNPWAKPLLSITGKHEWKPWKMDWPDVGFQLNAHAAGIYQPLYTVSLKHLYYWQRRTWSRQKDLRKRYQIHPNSTLAITLTTHDLILDQLELDPKETAEELAKFEGVDFIFTPNFSLYDNYPRMDNLFRLKCKWMALEELQKVGFKVVPDLCVVNSADLRNQVAWMRDNKCDVMLYNFQVQAVTTETREWMAAIKAVCAIRDQLGYPVRLVAYGGVGQARMQSIVENYGPNVTFIDAKSYRLAEYHKDVDDVVDTDIDVKELFHKNAHERRTRIAAAKARNLVPALFSEDRLSCEWA